MRKLTVVLAVMAACIVAAIVGTSQWWEGFWIGVVFTFTMALIGLEIGERS